LKQLSHSCIVHYHYALHYTLYYTQYTHYTTHNAGAVVEAALPLLHRALLRHARTQGMYCTHTVLTLYSLLHRALLRHAPKPSSSSASDAGEMMRLVCSSVRSLTQARAHLRDALVLLLSINRHSLRLLPISLYTHHLTRQEPRCPRNVLLPAVPAAARVLRRRFVGRPAQTNHFEGTYAA
jgi:hypothetical protein